MNNRCYCQSEISCKLSAIQPNCNMVCVGGCPKPKCGLLKPQNKYMYGTNMKNSDCCCMDPSEMQCRGSCPCDDPYYCFKKDGSAYC